MQKAANTQEEPGDTHRTVRFPWTRPLQRALLSVFGSFSVAVAVTAALTLVIVNENWDQPAGAFYWASYLAFVVYFAAAVWVFAAKRLDKVWAAFCGVVLICMVIVWAFGGDPSFGYGQAFVDLVLLALLCGTAWLGFAGLALSQDRHWQAVMGKGSCPPLPRFVLKCGGWGLLIASVVLALLRDGVAFGLLLWPLVAFAIALTLSFTLAYRPRWLRRVARLAEEIADVV